MTKLEKLIHDKNLNFILYKNLKLFICLSLTFFPEISLFLSLNVDPIGSFKLEIEYIVGQLLQLCLLTQLIVCVSLLELSRGLY